MEPSYTHVPVLLVLFIIHVYYKPKAHQAHKHDPPSHMHAGKIIKRQLLIATYYSKVRSCEMYDIYIPGITLRSIRRRLVRSLLYIASRSPKQRNETHLLGGKKHHSPTNQDLPALTSTNHETAGSTTSDFIQNYQNTRYVSI